MKKVKTNHKYIKVANTVKPLPTKNRKPFDLLEGGNYFVSFRKNMAIRCVLTALSVPDKDPDMIAIKYTGMTVNVFKNEIGRTPEEAVCNEVGFGQ